MPTRILDGKDHDGRFPAQLEIEPTFGRKRRVNGFDLDQGWRGGFPVDDMILEGESLSPDLVLPRPPWVASDPEYSEIVGLGIGRSQERGIPGSELKAYWVIFLVMKYPCRRSYPLGAREDQAPRAMVGTGMAFHPTALGAAIVKVDLGLLDLGSIGGEGCPGGQEARHRQGSSIGSG